MVRRNDSLPSACRDFEQELVLYYYGESAETERSRVESHLERCNSCRGFLEDLHKILPMTVKADEPPQAFWQSYSREIRNRLEAAEQKRHWWLGILSLLRPWPVPAVATALVVILALTLTLTRERRDVPPEAEAVLEVLPMAENLEFFKTMELLDVMDIIEAMASPGNGTA